MSYKFFEDVAMADVAFEAVGDSLEEMFSSAGMAVTNTMVRDLSSVGLVEKRDFEVNAKSVEMLLFNFLQEIVFYKDSEKLLLSKFEIEIDEKTVSLKCVARGDVLDMKKHDLVVDVKAVTMHGFQVENVGGRWRSQVILDI